MASKDRYDITQHANGPNAGGESQSTEGAWEALLRANREQSRSQGARGSRSRSLGDRQMASPSPAQDAPRPSRDSIIRNYNANAAARARDTKRHSQAAMQNFQEREERTLERQRQRSEYESMVHEGGIVSNIPPQQHMSQEQAKMRARELRAQRWDRGTMTTQQSLDHKDMVKENIEAERARRDVFSSRNAGRTSNRDVIDGRGSIDSRAFNERNELVGYSIDQRDRPDPLVEVPEEQVGRWNSQAGQGFAPSASRGSSFSRRISDLNNLSDSISGRADYRSTGIFSSIPTSAKLLILLIIILLGVLVYLLFF